MFIYAQGEYYSASEDELEPSAREEEEEEEPELSSKKLAEHSLVIKKIWSTQVSLQKEEQQRETLFYTRCNINTTVVKKLGLPVRKHPTPYHFQWLNDFRAHRVNKQVLVPFSIGKYKDELLCDVILMQTTHVLLGRLCQFDQDSLHHGRTNKYTVQRGSKKFTLSPLLPTDDQKDQLQMKKRRVEEKASQEVGVKKGKNSKANGNSSNVATSSTQVQVNLCLPRKRK